MHAGSSAHAAVARHGYMHELDKAAMGRRIRQIRIAAGLRQWELAKRLGTTQSAVHKYEHGVVPEPRRLVELARIGGTSLEWVLTGQHWDSGSSEQARLSSETLATAALLREIDEPGRATVDEALRLLREAVAALEPPASEQSSPDAAAVREGLREHGAETLQLLETAWRIQRAVLRRVSRDAESRLATRTPSVDGGNMGNLSAGRLRS